MDADDVQVLQPAERVQPLEPVAAQPRERAADDLGVGDLGVHLAVRGPEHVEVAVGGDAAGALVEADGVELVVDLHFLGLPLVLPHQRGLELPEGVQPGGRGRGLVPVVVGVAVAGDGEGGQPLRGGVRDVLVDGVAAPGVRARGLLDRRPVGVGAHPAQADERHGAQQLRVVAPAPAEVQIGVEAAVLVLASREGGQYAEARGPGGAARARGERVVAGAQPAQGDGGGAAGDRGGAGGDGTALRVGGPPGHGGLVGGDGDPRLPLDEEEVGRGHGELPGRGSGGGDRPDRTGGQCSGQRTAKKKDAEASTTLAMPATSSLGPSSTPVGSNCPGRNVLLHRGVLSIGSVPCTPYVLRTRYSGDRMTEEIACRLFSSPGRASPAPPSPTGSTAAASPRPSSNATPPRAPAARPSTSAAPRSTSSTAWASATRSARPAPACTV